MFAILWEYWIIVLESILYFILMNKKLSLREYRGKKIYISQIITLFWGTVILLVLNIMRISTLFTIMFCVVFHFVFSVVFFSNSLFSKIFWTIAYTAFGIFADFLAVVVPVYCLHYSMEQILGYGNIIRVIFTMLYILLLAFFIVTTLSFDSNTFKLEKHERFFFLLFRCFVS